MLPIFDDKLSIIILETGTILTESVTGIIIPVYKNKGSNIHTGNYRPITLLGKLFTSILNNRHRWK